MTTQNFFAFIPLSNWLRGFDRYRQLFDKAAIPGIHFRDGFYVLPEHAPRAAVHAVLEKTQALVNRLGVVGDRVVRLEARLPVSTPLDKKPTGEVASPNTFTGTGVGWRWPSLALPLTGQAFVGGDGEFTPAHHEEITAAAFALASADLAPWSQCAPRSFSVLPIARACNARCSFCFSKASISDEVVPRRMDLHQILSWSALARRRGATRAVITGGGEPTLLPFPALRDLIAGLALDFPSVLLITNGSRLSSHAAKAGDAAMLEVLSQWKAAGLTRIAVSRHGVDAASDAKIMGLAVPGAKVLSLITRAGLQPRLIGVLQRGGVETPAGVSAYLNRAAGEGCAQVCFKELYVSSLSENPKAPSRENQYCRANQVPLSMLLGALQDLGFEETDRLPWGSPVYEGVVAGVSMRVAAYTEPSVGWERSHGVVRSWNWLASGECLASLEDPASRLELPGTFE